MPIGALLTSVRAKYPGGAEHIERVRTLARAIAGCMGSPALDEPGAEEALLLHEIGTIGVADALLQRQGALTTTEMEGVQAHTNVGAEILRGMAGMALAAQIAVTHHERWDGSGYPAGLAGTDIPALSRILAVAGAYVAMTSDRPYRSAVPHEVAAGEIVACAGSQFDPDVAGALAELPPPRGLRIIRARN